MNCCQKMKEYTTDGHDDIFKDKQDNTWNVYGCCHCCYYLTDIKYCPWCGKKIN
jgi:hypothetical protein